MNIRGAAGALLFVVVATLLRAALDPLLEGSVPFVFHFIAIALAAWTGGLGSGLLATPRARWPLASSSLARR